MKDFQVGNVVYLKSGSPAMVISKIEESRIECTFFIKDTLRNSVLERNLLTKKNPNITPQSARVLSKGIEI